MVVGEFDRNKIEANEAIYDILDVIIHPGYERRTVNNDIALLRIESNIRFNDDVGPICLPEKDVTYTGYEAVVSGWGSQAYGMMFVIIGYYLGVFIIVITTTVTTIIINKMMII